MYRVSFLGPHHPGKGLDFVGEFHNNPRFGAGSRDFAHVVPMNREAAGEVDGSCRSKPGFFDMDRTIAIEDQK
jgi:hypothetical protein